MKVAPPGPQPTETAGRALLIVAEYLRFRYTGTIVRLFSYLKTDLPRQESRLSWAVLAAIGLVILATPLLAGLAPRLAALTFEDVAGETQSVSVAALILTFPIFSTAWGYLLSGAALGPGLVWIFVGLEYVYLVVQMGLVFGRSYLHLVPLFVPIVIGAVTAQGRVWGKMALLVVLASLSVRITPLSPSLRAIWYLLWPLAAAAMFGLHRLLARRPWLSVSTRVIIASSITLLYFVAVAAVGTRPGRLPEGLNLALNSAIGLLDVIWFLLGAAFVEGALVMGKFTRKVVEVAVPENLLSAVLLIVWTVLAVWAVLLPSGPEGFPIRSWAVALTLALLAVLAVRWRMRGIAKEWLSGWFIASVAIFAVLRVYATQDVGELLEREAGVLALAGFAYAITWAVAGRIRRIPLAWPGFSQPSLLLLYLGVALVISAATLFGLAADIQFLQKAIIVQQYKGAVSLWIPLALLALARAWPAVSVEARRRSTVAFFVAAVAAIPAFLLRATITPAVADLVSLAGVGLLTIVLLRLWPDVQNRLSAAAIGIAVALGFAVSLSQRVLVDTLPPLLTMLGGLSGIRLPMEWAVTVFQWSGSASWRSSDQILYQVAAPALTVLAALALVRVRWKMQGRGSGPRTPEAGGTT